MTDQAPVRHASTHDLDLGPELVVKRFRSWGRGEPGREWSTLRLIADHVPGLGPRPVSADLGATPPVIVMSRLPGKPLGAVPVDDAQLDAMATAIERLHTGIPSEVIAGVPMRIWHAAEALTEVRAWFGRQPTTGDDPTVRAAYDQAATWLHRPELDETILVDHVPVLGRADGNLANHIWDGVVVRLVDFEDSGRSDRLFELADLVEHLATRAAGISAADLTSRFALDRHAERRLLAHRRLFATFWLLMLLPGGPAATRNPPGTLELQAAHLLDLLG